MDINNDGNVEVLVAVSYYFDKEEYTGRELDFDPSLYVAGGLACWDLEVSLFKILSSCYVMLCHVMLRCITSCDYSLISRPEG